MKKILISILVVLVLATAYLLFLLSGTGAFRTINERPLEVIRQIDLFGPEDFEISYVDSFAIISSTERKKYPPKEEEFGNLYFLDLKQEQENNPLNLTEHLPFKFSPHGLSLFKLDSTYLISVINHANNTHSVESFELFKRDSLVHRKTLTDSSMVAPNDIVQSSPTTFYFTNDKFHSGGIGQFLESFVGIGYSNVIYFDGKDYRIVGDGIAFANGINIHRDNNLLLVGSSRGFNIHVFSIQESGDLVEKEIVQMPVGVDNIAVDSHSNIWISGHPNLLVYQDYFQRHGY
jgi:arylesterase/paraoxonase